MNSSKFFKVIKFIALAILFVAIMGWVVMSLWNWLVPTLFHGPVINFWQTIGLFVLSKILFGGFHGKGRHRGWGGNSKMRERWKLKMEERMSTMTEEEKEALKNRCGQYF